MFRSSRHRKSTALRTTARITALSLSVTMAVGGAAISAQAGDVGAGTASIDVVATGALSAAEITAAGVAVDLVPSVAASSAWIALDGAVEFTKAPAGTYQVTVKNLPAGYTTGAVIADSASDSAWAVGALTSETFAVADAAAVKVRLDIVAPTTGVDVTVWNDVGGNHAYDAGEKFDAAASVQVVDAAAATVGTLSIFNATGHAKLALAAGDYTAIVTPATGWAAPAGTATSVPFTVTAGSLTPVKFGLVDTPDGTITVNVTTVAADSSTSPTAGVRFELTLPASADPNAVVATSTSGADGTVRFTAVPTGEYALRLAYAKDLVLKDNAGDFRSDASYSRLSSVTAAGTPLVFTAVLKAGAGIDTVNLVAFNDLDNNGAKGTSEPLVDSTATIKLGTVIAATLNAAALRATVAADTYTYDFAVAVPARWTLRDTAQATGPITLAAGGYTILIPLREVSGLVTVTGFEDVNANGTRESATEKLVNASATINRGTDAPIAVSTLVPGASIPTGDYTYTVAPTDATAYSLIATATGSFTLSTTGHDILVPLHQITGIVSVSGFEDLNGNGVRDAATEIVVNATATIKRGTDTAIAVTPGLPSTLTPTGLYGYTVAVDDTLWKLTGTGTGSFTLTAAGRTILVPVLKVGALTGAVSVSGFEDTNANGVRDSGEKVVAATATITPKVGAAVLVSATAAQFAIGDYTYTVAPADATAFTLKSAAAGLFTLTKDGHVIVAAFKTTVVAPPTDTRTCADFPDWETAQAALTEGATQLDDGFGVACDGLSSAAAPQIVPAGGVVAATGTGFTAGELVEVWIHSDPVLIGNVLAEGGSTSTTVALPNNLAVGIHHLEMRGVTSGVSTWTTLEVLAAPAGNPSTATPVSATTAAPRAGTLPITGAEGIGMMLMLTGLLVGVGGLLVTRRRKHAALLA